MVNNLAYTDEIYGDERYLDGEMMANMVRGGAANLRSNAREVNDLNVFPVPDGDTGDNMSMTMEGGVAALEGVESTSLADVMAHISQGMLLGARGNSGVILSQFFAGMNKGFTDCDKADAHIVGQALEEGVRQAYSSVITPTEGTILTVAREAVQYAVSRIDDNTTISALFTDLTSEMYASLQRTPEILDVLKEAGVIDSGGAGLFYIMLGFSKILQGEEIESSAGTVQSPKAAHIDLNAFGPDSEMTYGYCTEMLLRLQNAKVDIAAFDVSIIIDYLTSIGDSIVCVKNDSIVKLHVHTMTPGNVLSFCQQFGEALTVKIENMNVQHSETQEPAAVKAPAAPVIQREKPAKEHGTVAVASGDGIADLFRQLGVDAVVSGGQTQNPSAQDFLSAFEEVGAKHIYVFPNNGNIVMAAKQAGQLYAKGEVHVIESKDLGQGYAAISSLNFQSDDAEQITAQLTEAMSYVKTASVSTSIRDADISGVHIETGDFIGFMGKEMLVSRKTLGDAAKELLLKLGVDTGEVYMVTAFTGTDASQDVIDDLQAYMEENYPDVEFYTVAGGQEVYPFIFVVE